MIAYKLAPFRLGRQWLRPDLSLSQAAPPSADVKAAAATGLLALGGVALIELGITAGGTWVGIRTGLKEKGFLSFTGWVVGITSGVGALASLAALIVGVAAAARIMSTPPSTAQTTSQSPLAGR